MSEAIEKLQRQIDLHLNIISCDQQMFGVILQVLLGHLIGGSPDKTKAFHRVRDEVLGAIDNTLESAEDSQGAERRKQMTRMRAEVFFDVVGEAVGIGPHKPDPSVVS